MKTFKGRMIVPGTVTAEAVVSHGGLNTLASFQKALQFGDKKATCGDQNNPDLYGKQMAGKALCLPQTIGSTTGGLVIYCACSLKRQPACMLFSKPIDSLAGAGVILADVWLDDVKMPVVDSLGEEFLEYVKDGMQVSVAENGEVTGAREKERGVRIGHPRNVCSYESPPQVDRNPLKASSILKNYTEFTKNRNREIRYCISYNVRAMMFSYQVHGYQERAFCHFPFLPKGSHSRCFRFEAVSDNETCSDMKI